MWGKRYYQENRERVNDRISKHREANPEGFRAARKRYQEKRKDWYIAYKRNWLKVNRAKMNEYSRRRAARKRGATIGDVVVIARFYQIVSEAESISCYWCGKAVPKEDREVDHIYPINLGGAHAVLNLCCSCMSCNRSKCDNLPEKFRNRQYEMFYVISNQQPASQQELFTLTTP